MEDVVVMVDSQKQQQQQQQQQQQRMIVNRSSPPRKEDDERISIVCDVPRSPSPKRSVVKSSSCNVIRSRGSSYNFSEDEQPLQATIASNPAAAAAEGEPPNARNKSFDFGVSLSANSSSASNGGHQRPGNGNYYRLPSPRDEQVQQKLKKRSPADPAAEIDVSINPSVERKMSLRSAIRKAEDTDSSDDDDQSRGKQHSTRSFSFRDGKHTTVTGSGGPPAMLAAEAVVVKAPTNFNRLKSKSRLAEPPPPATPARSLDQATPESSPSKLAAAAANPSVPSSGRAQEAEEEDPLRDADLPDKYRHHKWGFCSVLQLVFLILLTALLVCSCTVSVLKQHKMWSLELWKWALMALVIVSGRLLSGWLIHIIVFFIERNFMWRKRVLYFVYGLRKGVQTAVWLGLALIAWLLLFDPKVERSTKNHKALTYVTKILVCFLLAAFIWLGKLLFVKVLASSYHVNTYFDRIQESLFSQYILEKLSGLPRDDLEAVLPELQQSTTFKSAAAPAAAAAAGKKDVKSSSQQDPLLSIDKLQQMNQKNVSAWNMKRLVMLVKHSKISTLSQTLESTAIQEECKENEIHTEWQARSAAKEVFRNVAKPGSKHIVLDDLLRFLTDSEAQRALTLFEGAAEAGTITKKNLVSWVTNVYRERRSLALSLNDTKTAVDKLHHIINAVTAIIILIIWLLVLGLATSHLLVVVSSQILLIVFVFGNTCKTVFEAIIFLFVMHPYDVGDRCVIDGVQMVVEEMNILTTVFLRYDNEKIYYPNSVLANKPISNYYRSPDMNDAIEFTVDMSTPVEKIAALKDKVAKHISSKSAHWHNKSTIVVKDIEDMNRMKMALWVQHTMNYQLAGERTIRRSELVIKLKTFCEELGIEYHLLPQEVTLSSRQ